MTSNPTQNDRSPPVANDHMHRASLPDDAAPDQIALITGSADTSIRIRAVYGNRKGENKQQHPSYEYEGPLADIHERTRKLNLDGHNIYMVAQLTRPLPAKNHFTRDADIVGIRCLYADGDNSELPSEWRVEPTFLLVHPKTGRWWAYWRVTNFPLGDLRDMIKRIAHHYDADVSISNAGRIVRLAGYDRWKDGENYGPYELYKRSCGSTEPWQHEGLSPLPSRAVSPTRHRGSQKNRERAPYEGRDDAKSVIELNRLRQLLLLVPPGNREDWLKIMFVIRDGTVIDDKFEVLDDADKLALFDSWASGELYEEMTGVSP